MAVAGTTRNKEKCVKTSCSPFQFNEVMQGLKRKLKDRHWDVLNKTPFGHLFELGGIHVYQSILGRLVSLWDSKTNSFKLGEQLVSFDASDVALALGLSMRGERISVYRSRKKLNIPGWRFETPSASRQEIVAMIDSLVDNDDRESIEMTVKLLLLLLFSTVLFTQTMHKVHASFFPYIDNIESIGNFAWANAVYEYLLDSLNRCSTRKCRLAGCSIVMQVWIFEHTKLWSSSDPNALPRLFKWKTKLHTFTPVQQILIKLVEDKQLNPSQVLRRLTLLRMEEALLPPTGQIPEEISPVGEEEIAVIVQQRVTADGVEEQLIPSPEPSVEYPTKVSVEQRTTLDTVEAAVRRAVAPESELRHELEDIGEEESQSVVVLDATEVEDIVDVGSQSVVGMGSIERNIKVDKPRKATRLLHTSYAAGNKKRKVTVIKADAGKEYLMEEDTPLQSAKAQAFLNLDESAEVVRNRVEFVSKSDLMTLYSLDGCLHGVVIDMYGAFLNERDQVAREAGAGACVCISSRYHAYLNHFKDHIKINARNLLNCVDEILNSELRRILLPVCESQHWILLMLDVEEKSFKIYNSVNLCFKDRLKLTIERLTSYFGERNMSIDNWKVVNMRKLPRQDNSVDCGVYVMKFMECLSRYSTISFTKKDIPQLRRTLVDGFLDGLYGECVLK
ncbi:uncharacterized protein LOC143892252 isoform X2 [Tasmannia lanceolata]